MVCKDSWTFSHPGCEMRNTAEQLQAVPCKAQRSSFPPESLNSATARQRVSLIYKAKDFQLFICAESSGIMVIFMQMVMVTITCSNA